jgi:hypothetical protein
MFCRPKLGLLPTLPTNEQDSVIHVHRNRNIKRLLLNLNQTRIGNHPILPLFVQREMSQIERPLVTFKLSEWVVVLGFDLANCLYSQRMKVSENKTMTFAKSCCVNLCTWLANLID